MELLPFSSFTTIVTKKDGDTVAELLGDDGKLLMCDVCECSTFRVEVFIKTSVVITAGEVPIVFDDVEDPKREVYALRVIECVRCGSKDFIAERNDG